MKQNLRPRCPSGGDSSDGLATIQAGDAEATDTEATVWHAEAD
jgi:hypothetical protein